MPRTLLNLGAHEAMKASSGVQTRGSLRTLKLVFTITGQPVRFLNFVSMRGIGD